MCTGVHHGIISSSGGGAAWRTHRPTYRLPDSCPTSPQIRNVTRRTCSVCVPTRDMLMAQRLADLGLSGDDPLQLMLPVWPGDGAVVEGGSGSASGSHGLVGMEGSGGGGGSTAEGSTLGVGSRRGGHGRAAGRQDE